MLWPAPAVITGYQPAYSFDDPKRATSVGTTAHPLYVRSDTVSATPLWQKSGTHPYPTAFVAGSNQAHTATPGTTVLGATDVVAAGAAAQKGLSPAVAVLSFKLGATDMPYGSAPNGPTATSAADVVGALAALKAATSISAELEKALTPDPAKLATWYPPGSAPAVAALAERLLFTANAFRHGLVGTVIMPAVDDDPHGAFATAGYAATRADTMAKILDSFYAELASGNETSCSHDGKPLSVADNTVLVASGDTPKNSFDNVDWPDGSPLNSNLVYVRSNGFLVPGWFGALTPQGKSDFDPKTGELVPSPAAAASKTGALQGLLYAITRGDAKAVAAVAPAAYDGLIAKP
jgi:hypothetical protein